MLFLPTAVLTVGASVVAGFYMHRIGYRRLAVITMSVSALGFGIIAVMRPEAGVMPAVVGISLVGTAIGISFPVLLIVAQNTVEATMLGVATSLVQLARSLGGTLGVAVLGAYLATRLVGHTGGAVSSNEVAALLRPEALGALNAVSVALLRTELADALRAIFAVGAVMMAIAALIAMRLEAIPVVQRRGRRAPAESAATLSPPLPIGPNPTER
jgi:MFS family permease